MGYPKFYYSPVNCRSGILSSLLAVNKKKEEKVGHPPSYRQLRLVVS